MQIATYYFPNYHQDKRNLLVHGDGWTEWNLIKNTKPKSPLHQQPKVPLWGYEDESDPIVMAKKINIAADYGINSFIFDWYYYNDGTFLEGALNDGFLKANNRDRLDFALMWANHDWLDMHPASSPNKPAKVLYPGKISIETFDKMTNYVIQKYFTQKNYWKLDGCPYFSIYELSMFIESMGGTKQASLALARFRDKAKAAGFPDIHLNAVYFKVPVLQREKELLNAEDILQELNFDSITSYVWMHHYILDQPFIAASEILKKYLDDWDKICQDFTIPYFPNVTVAWDNNPRYTDDFIPVMTNTAVDFKAALEAVKKRINALPSKQRILTINAWNEWTEGSYLEPDTKNNYAFLEAVKSIKD